MGMYQDHFPFFIPKNDDTEIVVSPGNKEKKIKGKIQVRVSSGIIIIL